MIASKYGTRNSTGGRDRKSVITQVRLTQVVNQYPGEAFYPTQRGLLRAIVERGLYTEDSAALLKEIEGKISVGMSENTVYALASDIQVTPVIKSFSGRKIDISTDAIGNGKVQEIDELRTAKAQAEEESKRLRGEIEALNLRVATLENKLAEQTTHWWRTTRLTYHEFTEAEQDLLDSLLVDPAVIGEVLKKHRLLPNQATRLIVSAVSKVVVYK